MTQIIRGLATIIALWFVTFPAFAAVSIVATVNGDPITSYELEQRVALLADATNIEITDQNREVITSDALQMLIDDKLKLQVSIVGKPGIEGAAMAKANELIDATFAENGLTGMKVLREIGIDPATVQSKYISDLVWIDFLRSTYRDKFDTIDAKVEAEIKRLVDDASQPQIRLSEIILTPAPNRNFKQTLNLATQMVAAVRKGANFNAIAQQYSSAGSAQQGGRVGWVTISRLPETFIEALAPLENGEVTEPIALDGNVFIFRRDGKREKGLADDSQIRVWLARAIVPLAEDASDADRLEAAARIKRDSENVKNCDDVEALNTKYESQAVARLNDMVLSDLAPNMQELVNGLEDNQPSEPISFSNGVATMMVCKRGAPELNLPPRKDIEQRVADKLFGVLSERHLIRLRRSAVIDVRG